MTTLVDSLEIHTLCRVEDLLWTADFTTPLSSPADTIASVTGCVELTSLGLTVGVGTVNLAAIDASGRTIAIGKAVQVRISAASARSGDAVVRAWVLTASGNTWAMDCRIAVV